jgi:hypothetical protein
VKKVRNYFQKIFLITNFLKVTITYLKEKGKTASTHFHECHQILALLKCGEKGQLSKEEFVSGAPGRRHVF